MNFQLAQANIAKMKFDLDHPQMTEFVNNIERINQLAEDSDGFVWRFQTTEGNALSEQAYDDERILFNMSVWASVEHLKKYVYMTQHVDFIKNNGRWFNKMESQHLVLWWVRRGHIPTVDEAKTRLELIRRKGPGEQAFSIANPYPAPLM